MKKMTLFFTLFLVMMSYQVVGETQNYLMKLTGIESDDLQETVYYVYLDNYLLETSNSMMNDGTKVIDSMTYDEAGNPTMIKFYQLINDQWRWVSYVAFTYDDNGNKLTRENFNDFGSGFELGGSYHYFYNETQQMTNWELYMGGELSQICDFTYNDAGLKVEEIGQQSLWGSPMENNWKIEYQYDENNNCISSSQFFWGSGSWDLYSVDQFFFDEFDNCIKKERLIDNVVVDRHEYFYESDYTFDQLVFPNNPEAFFPEFVQMRQRLVLDKWYTEDANGQLSYICDYNYIYESIAPQDGPSFSVTPGSLEFLMVTSKEENGTLTISNSGNADGNFVATITGENAEMFAFNNEAQAVVAPDASYDLIVEVIDGEWESGFYHATIVFETDDPLHSVIEIPVVLEVQLSIEEQNVAFSVYPNPATSLLNIQTESCSLITICDLLGHVVYQSNNTSNNHQLNVSQWTAGYYFIQLKDQNGKTKTQRVMVRK
ncbi:MAG: T9SS type A sorting domain-containing protein [Bacteroidales bacterium]|nr:T9SS type A sorting domain-containing protein [Bacteroidales bacterium]